MYHWMKQTGCTVALLACALVMTLPEPEAVKEGRVRRAEAGAHPDALD